MDEKRIKAIKGWRRHERLTLDEREKKSLIMSNLNYKKLKIENAPSFIKKL